jgi:tetratricopeptide (TPR) repeat protein
MLGRTYCYLKEGQQSVESFNRAFRMQPTYKKSVSDLIAAASVHSQIGDDEGSLQLYRDAVALQPKNDEAQYGLGWTLLHLGKNDDAEPHLRLAMKFKPDNADAHYNLGLVLFDLKRLSEAESEYRAAVKLNPARPDFQYALGFLLSREEKYADAIPCYEEALRNL